MWREKAIKISLGVFAFNLLVAIGNLGFAYGHYVKHEMWSIAVSIFFVCLNGGIAWNETRNIKQYRQELKDEMWHSLTREY